MSSSLFNDRRASKLLSRVREDVTHLREDIASLLSHSTKKTLPHGARELASQAKSQLSSGSAYAAKRIRSMRGAPEPSHIGVGVAGGVLAVGLLAAGAAWYMCKWGCDPVTPRDNDYRG